MPIINAIPSVRISPANDDISKELGFLAELAGTWHGKGFNLIARPDGLGGQPLFLELNETSETLRIDEIGSDIPNRGDAVADIDLFGLTYLQKISDSVTGGALHIEPGIWVRTPDDPASPNQQNATRMATIPHGNALLAEGTAIQVSPAGGTFNFDPVNTAPFKIGDPMPPGGTVSKFPEFDLAVPESAANPKNSVREHASYTASRGHQRHPHADGDQRSHKAPAGGDQRPEHQKDDRNQRRHRRESYGCQTGRGRRWWHRKYSIPPDQCQCRGNVRDFLD